MGALTSQKLPPPHIEHRRRGVLERLGTPKWSPDGPDWEAKTSILRGRSSKNRLSHGRLCVMPFAHHKRWSGASPTARRRRAGAAEVQIGSSLGGGLGGRKGKLGDLTRHGPGWAVTLQRLVPTLVWPHLAIPVPRKVWRSRV